MNNHSVLNTDHYDRRRWKQILGQAPKLQEIEKRGNKNFPTFSPLMGDMWAYLFKSNPQLLKEVNPKLLPNQSIITKLQSDETYQLYRETTKLDDLASAIGSVNMSEQVMVWIERQQIKNQEFNKLLQQANLSQNGDEEDSQGNEAMEALSQMLQELMNDDSFSRAIQQGIQQSKDAQSGLENLFNGIQPGSGDSELKKVPLREKIALAEKLKQNQKLNKIAEWAGRFKSIAQKKQKTKKAKTLVKNGIELGKDIERMLPMELALFKNSATKSDFMRRFAEGQVMQYELEGKAELGKGPIVLCLDQSSSMKAKDEISKGFMLALMSIARKQKRDFAYIPFDRKAPETYIFEKGKISISQMIELAENFLNGGTDFHPPLEKSLKVIQNSRFKNSDIIFITDGEADYNSWYVDVFNAEKEKLGINVLTILIGTKSETAKIFSDRIVNVSDFTDDAALTAFEI